MKKSIIILLLLLTAYSCKKDNQKQYSTWYVNGQKFTTNDVRANEGKVIHEIIANSWTNNFAIVFNTGFFPTDGDFLINCSQQSPNWCCLSIIYHKLGYINPKNTSIHAGTANHKAQYILNEAWFYNELDNNDSILVKGVFNEP